jgi:hypothetical protein
MDGFHRWLKWRMNWCDLDHYMCNNTYRDTDLSATKKPMSEEQTLWFCLIFGMTYQSEMAWVIYNQFPNFWDIDLEEMQRWNVKNMELQKYARDCKYNKGRITDQVSSLRGIVGPSKSLKKFFEDLLEDTPERSFSRTYSVVKENFYKFGRMTTWLVCQTLYETANLPISPNNMLASDPSSWSVRSGLMYVYNQDHLIEAKDKGLRLSQKDMEWVTFKEGELYNSSLEYLDKNQANIFSHYLLESHLCQYKKLMLGGDYAGHSSGDHVSRALWLKDRWPEVNFDSFFKTAVDNHHPLVRGCQEIKSLRNLCAQTGQMINMHTDYEDMPNVYEELEIEQSWLKEGEKAEKKVLRQIEKYSEKLSLHN